MLIYVIKMTRVPPVPRHVPTHVPLVKTKTETKSKTSKAKQKQKQKAKPLNTYKMHVVSKYMLPIIGALLCTQSFHVEGAGVRGLSDPGAKLGVNLSTKQIAWDSPMKSAKEAVDRLDSIANVFGVSHISRVKLFGYGKGENALLFQELLGRSYIKDIMFTVSLHPTTTTINRIAGYAQDHPDKTFHLAIGNEIGASQYAEADSAIRDYYSQLVSSYSNIQLTVPFAFNVINGNSLPNTQAFKNLVNELNYFTINPYPFFQDRSQEFNDYYTSTDCLNGYIDLVEQALTGIGMGHKEIVIGETGWPSAGAEWDPQSWVSAAHSETAFRNAAEVIKTNTRVKAGYLFGLFDEAQKGSVEANFGILNGNGDRKW
mmetsp:Transcript_17805/g.28821  ORF Transcript_17805/g.28821 Transcript_17805/m.28821 type:complete len:372 (+) Transcript_17805:28-1143(+)